MSRGEENEKFPTSYVAFYDYVGRYSWRDASWYITTAKRIATD